MTITGGFRTLALTKEIEQRPSPPRIAKRPEKAFERMISTAVRNTR